MTKSTIRVAIDVGSKSHWVGVGLSEGQVLERFSIAHNQKGFEHFSVEWSCTASVWSDLWRWPWKATTVGPGPWISRFSNGATGC